MLLPAEMRVAYFSLLSRAGPETAGCGGGVGRCGVPLQLGPRGWAWGRGLPFACKPPLARQVTCGFINS